MPEQRILSITTAQAEWMSSSLSPSGEYITWVQPMPFDLLDGNNLEISIHMNAWCSGLTAPPDPRIRFRLGGSALAYPSGPWSNGPELFVNEATHGALVAEFDVSTGYYAGDFWNAPWPEFNQSNTKRFGGVYTVAKPSGREFFRMSAFADNTDRGCGMASLCVDFRGLP